MTFEYFTAPNGWLEKCKLSYGFRKTRNTGETDYNRYLINYTTMNAWVQSRVWLNLIYTGGLMDVLTSSGVVYRGKWWNLAGIFTIVI